MARTMSRKTNSLVGGRRRARTRRGGRRLNRVSRRRVGGRKTASRRRGGQGVVSQAVLPFGLFGLQKWYQNDKKSKKFSPRKLVKSIESM